MVLKKTIKKNIPLSAREIQVLKLVCKEKTNNEIGKILKISPNTVDFHRKNIYQKTKTTSIVGLVKYAIRKGIASANR